MSYYPTKFDSSRQCGSGDIRILVSHIISQDSSSKCHVTLWVEARQSKSPFSQFNGCIEFGRADIMI